MFFNINICFGTGISCGKEGDNIAISAHFTRSEKLTRGAIQAKLMYIKKGMKSKDGVLKPNESFTQKLKSEHSL